MNNAKMNWLEVGLTDGLMLSECSNILHHACRYIALTGKYFIEEAPDDSHTSAVWIPEKQWLAGQSFDTIQGQFKVALNYTGLALMIVNDELKVANELSLSGKTDAEAFSWLEEQLRALKLNTKEFKNQLHFEIPFHPIDEQGVFEIPSARYFKELSKYRTNGHQVLVDFAAGYHRAEPVLLWPHHFDEGCHIPQQTDGNKTTASFSIGVAPPDKYYTFPYFFVITWAKNGIDYSNLPPIGKPGSWHTHEWTGQVLAGDRLIRLSKTDQYKTVYTFMEAAINNALTLLDRR